VKEDINLIEVTEDPEGEVRNPLVFNTTIRIIQTIIIIILREMFKGIKLLQQKFFGPSIRMERKHHQNPSNRQHKTSNL